MNTEAVERVANAVLYEGYLLYPYRRSALKNRRRWDFGVVYPSGREADNEPSFLQTQCLVESSGNPLVETQVRFLHTFVREDGEESWQEATPRSIDMAPQHLEQLVATSFHCDFEFPADGSMGLDVIQGALKVSVERLEQGLYRYSLRICNTAVQTGSTVAERLARALASTHAILGVRDGAFVSVLEPPDSYRNHAAACRNTGLWPVLAGEKPSRTIMLASPIILYDYPEIAPESAGDLFDGTEIDELLTLRVLTLTDDEKQEIRVGDPRGRAILERSEKLSDEGLQRLHGSIRELRPATKEEAL
jgi:hydrogenase maturation protease